MSGHETPPRRQLPVAVVGHLEAKDNATGVAVHVHTASGSYEVAGVRTNIQASWSNKPFAGRAAEGARIDELLADTSQPQAVVLFGGPGNGKSHLAVHYALDRAHRYPGGVYLITVGHSGPPSDLLRLARGLDPSHGSMEERCDMLLASLGKEPTLLVYDEILHHQYIERWGPLQGQALHIVATTTRDAVEGAAWPTCCVEPLPKEDANLLARDLLGPELFAAHGREVLSSSDGMPLQLVTAAGLVRASARRGHPIPNLSLLKDPESRLERAWKSLPNESQRALQLCAMFEPTRIPLDEVRERLGPGSATALDGCMDEMLLDPAGRMHRVISLFVQQRHPAEVHDRDVHMQAFVAAARAVVDKPSDDGSAARFDAYPHNVSTWEKSLCSKNDVFELALDIVGEALLQLGRFEEARSWFERAVQHGEQGDRDGRIDYTFLGKSLHRVGYCLSQQGLWSAALGWSERAVQHKQQEDVHGRIDHLSMGTSLHLVGYCLSQQGLWADARDWSERAVQHAEQGDVHGRIDHESLGTSLHLLGYCLSRQGLWAEARGWFERAVQHAEQGDVHGRIDHLSLGKSLHQVGYCLSQQELWVDARDWSERAVHHKQHGDVHGRIDHDSLGKSLYLVGYCLSQQGLWANARGWFERTIHHAEQGDVHGRIDHLFLGKCLRRMGDCLSQQGLKEEACNWYARAEFLSQ